jgi:hypothetical protein
MRGVRTFPASEHVFRGAWGMAEILSNGGYIKAFDEDGDGDTHCAELIKHWRVFDAAPTWEWRKGRPLMPGMKIEPGTAIATFDERGRYPAGPVKHAAIFIGFAEGGTGILVLDQWDGTGLRYRELPWNYPGTNPHSTYVNSAINFSTIIW